MATQSSKHDSIMRDLSQAHEPVSDLFQLPASAADWRRYRLRDEQLAFYEENGYVAGVRILTEAQCDRLCDELSGLVAAEGSARELFYEFNSNEARDPSTVLFHALGAWRVSPGFHDLPWHPALVVPASQLLGGAIRFWHDQLFCKPPHHGGVVAWHQDYSYWTRTQPMAHLTCWIGLDGSTPANGGLRYVPGSHHWDLLPITGLAGDMNAIARVLSDEQLERLSKPVCIELKRGEATFHHPLLIHGSQENRTPRPRRAAVVNVIRDGVCSASDEPLLKGVPPIAKGQPLGGTFFPLLFDPAAMC